MPIIKGQRKVKKAYKQWLGINCASLEKEHMLSRQGKFKHNVWPFVSHVVDILEKASKQAMSHLGT